MEELYLGIETSCDDTSCAVYSPARGVVVHRTAAQLDHEKYGGVVPEIASRSHMRTLLPLYETAMSEAGASPESLAGIGVTNGPGLTGSLLVGLSFAKALAYACRVPLAGVHHIEGHILANALEGPLDLPALVLVVSGGHTQLIHMERIGRYEIVGGTRDDAAGEAFDKIGKLLGLPFPGGPSIERAARERGARRLYLAGGVASNGRLRALMKERLEPEGVAVSWPRPEYCTDNAAMIACAASCHIRAGRIDGLDLNSFARGNIVNWAS
jgi:N6-L-threonylcarbamoyladenine synthase